ncbi:MAG: ferredoxin family protein [Dehalococcoidales bacterium]|nr:ferredoxin family protein [Dehalococcoidales bacterium]
MKYWRKPLDQDHLKTQHYQVDLITDRCKGCGLCIEFCPRHVLAESAEFNRKGYHPIYAVNDDCLNCGLCELMCPEFAIRIVQREGAPARE